jgi:thiol-disulfide isomerase/thioredoxin
MTQEADSPLLTPPSADEPGAAEGAVTLTAASHAAAEARHPLLLVNFYAPWCPWSQRMTPVWEAAARTLHGRYPTGSDGRILLGKVDCTLETELCREAQIQGFPSVRVFRGGSDLVTNTAALGRGPGGMQEHATYVGDRTVEALVAFAESLLPPARAQQRALPSGARASDAAFTAAAAAGMIVGGAHPGCAIDGFVFVKKVPGALFVSAQSESHSFVAGAMNMSHAVNELYLGHRPPPRKIAELARLLPGGLPPSWSDKLAGGVFGSAAENTTHEHYLQIVRTVVQPLHARGGRIDAYEYTVHSHAYESSEGHLPHAKFSFAPSPMLVFVQEEARYGAYHFITTVSALIGGVFTVASIADSATHAAARLLKKGELGKQY